MAVSSELGLKVVITGVSQVISGLKSIDNAASGLGTVLKGVGKVGSGALKLLTAPLRAIGKVAGLAWKGLTAVAKSIWRIGEYVVGNLIARGITAIGSAIVNMASAAIEGAANMQMMQVSIEGLLARELMRGQLVTETSTSIRNMTQAERRELNELTVSYYDLGVELSEEQTKYNDLIASEQEGSIELLRQGNIVAALTAEYDAQGAEMTRLQGIEGSLIQQEREYYTNTMSNVEARQLLASEDVNRAEAITKELMMLALISPFQMQQTNETFRLAMAYGMASDKAIPFTEAVLDTAAGLGMSNKAVERFVYNLSQAVIGGDLTGINLRQLSLTSFNLAQVLRDELGLSIEEVREQLKAGKLTLEEVSEAFVHNAEVVWAGAAERARNTWTGFKNSLEDLNSVMGALIVEPALSAISKAAVPLFDAFTAVVASGTLEKIGETLGIFIEKGLGLLPIQEIADTFPAIFWAIRDALTGDFESAWIFLMSAVQTVFGDETMAKIYPWKDTIVDVFNIITGLIKGDFGGAWETLKKVVGDVFGEETRTKVEEWETKIITAWEAINTWVTTYWPVIQAKVLAALKGILDWIVTNAPEMEEKVVSAWKGIKKWVDEELPKIRDKWVEDWEVITASVVASESTIVNTSIPSIQAAMDSLTASMDEDGVTIGYVWEKLKDVISGVIAIIVGILTGFINSVARVIAFFIKEWEMAKTNFENIGEGIKGYIDAFFKIIKGIFTGDMALIWEGWKQSWESIWLIVVSIVASIWNTLTLGLRLIVEIVRGFVEGVIEYFKNLYKELVGDSIIPDMMADIVTAIETGLNDAVAKIGEFIEKFKQKGIDLIQGLIDGVKAMAGAFGRAVASVVSGGRVAAEEQAEMESPSQVMFRLGVDFVQGLIDGVESQAEEFEDVVKGLFDVAGTLSGIGSFFSGIYERQKVDPLKAILKEMNDNMDAMAEHKRGLEEQIEAEQEQALRDAAALEIEGIEAAQDAQEEAIRATAEAQKDALNDAHSEMLTIIANEFDLRGDKIKEIIALQEDEQKTLYSDESDAIKRQYDDEELLFKDQISDEERAVKDLYDEKTALYNDAIDAEKRAIRERDDIEKEEMYLLLDDVDTRKRADILALNALEQAELDAIQQSERDGLREISDREDTALDASIAAKEAALAAIQQDEEDRIRVLAAKEQDAITEAIALYERRIDTADEAERVALETLIAQSEAQRDAITARMEEEIAIIEVRMAATEQEVRAEEIRLDIIRQIEEEERRILELKEKQDQLKMLDQQRKLLELIAEYELDAGSILEGLTLGLNADAGDVLDAMVGAMTGIIEALESTLEISSPSGVFRTIGQQMMAGISEGVADLTPAVIAQINAAVSPVMSGGGGITNIYNNNSQMSHNLTTQSITRPGALALEFDAMAMASR